MIELSFKNINDGNFHQGVNKLAKYEGFSPKVAYKISRIADKIGQHTREAQIAYKKIMDKYAAKDEKGMTVQTQTPPFFAFKDGMKQEDFQKEHDEFLSITVQIDKWEKISLGEVPQGLGLSAIDMTSLEPLLSFEEETKEAAKVVPIKK